MALSPEFLLATKAAAEAAFEAARRNKIVQDRAEVEARHLAARQAAGLAAATLPEDVRPSSPVRGTIKKLLSTLNGYFTDPRAA
jgi:hypothetical protein